MAYLVMSIDMKIRRIDSKHILDFECKWKRVVDMAIIKS
jgi:hypothetical protein